MSTQIATAEPGTNLQAGEKEWHFQITIKVPVYPPQDPPPHSSFLVAVVLMELLRVKLADSGVSDVVGGGAVNRTIINLSVRNPAGTIEIIRDALLGAKLLQFATIYELDEREIVWRSRFPDTSRTLLFKEAQDEMDRNAEELQRNMAAAEEYVQSLGCGGEATK